MMKVTRGRKVVFNPAPYETVEVFASITHEIGDEDDPAENAAWLDSQLTELLAPEIEAVADVTTNSKSIVSQYRYTEEGQ